MLLKKYRYKMDRLFKKYTIILFLSLFACYPLSCKFLPDSIKPAAQKNHILPLSELRDDIQSIINNSDMANAFIGVCVQSSETGEYFYKLNETKNFIPASNLKLLTTAAALEYLGKDFTFSTACYLDGKINPNNEFIGNIIVRGLGDPTLSGYFFENPLQFFEKWALKLDSAGINSIRGNIIADDRYFDRNYYAPGWAFDDMMLPFSPQVSALSVFDNKIDIIVSPPDKEGEKGKVKVFPENSYVRIINNLKPSAPGTITELIPYRENNSNIIELYGSIASDSVKREDSRLSVCIDNPSSYFLNLFKHSIEKNNIRFRGALLNVNDLNQPVSYAGLLPFDINLSPPLKVILPVVNQKSHNLIAEILLKTIGKEKTGTGSYARGIEQVKKFADKSGIATDNICIVDGSGLSRLNLLSPKSMVALLNSVYHSDKREIFMSSLAQPGKNGTLKRRMTQSRAEFSVMAKTGSMNGISNLSGYLVTKDKEVLSFSIMMMGFTVPESIAQNLQDLICMRLASFSRKPE